MIALRRASTVAPLSAGTPLATVASVGAAALARGLLLGVALCVGGCSRRAPSPSPSTSVTLAPEVVGSPQDLAALKHIRGVLQKAVAADHAAGLNLGSYEETVRKAQRQEQGTGLTHAIPDRHDPAQFADALSKTAQASGVRIQELAVIVRKTPPGTPPPTTEGPYHWQQKQIRRVYDVRFKLEALSAESVRRWYREVKQSLPRLLLLTKLAAYPGGWTVEAEIYAFRAAQIPRHEPPPHSLDAMLAAAKVSPDPIGAEARALLGACKAMAQSARRERPELLRALVPLAKAHWYTARFTFFQDRLKALASVSTNQLMGAKPAHQ